MTLFDLLMRSSFVIIDKEKNTVVEQTCDLERINQIDLNKYNVVNTFDYLNLLEKSNAFSKTNNNI